MGRLEEMLEKIHARSLERTGPHASASEGLPSFENAVNGAVEAVPHQYGGKRRVLNLERLQEQRMLGKDAEERRLADEFRVIKRPLLKNSLASRDPPLRRANLWMVTSAIAGEGKTFTSLNLWLSVARERD